MGALSPRDPLPSDIPIELRGHRVLSAGGGALRIDLLTSGGDIRCLLHEAPGEGAVIWVWGYAGGFDGPSHLYETVAEDLVSRRVASLRLDYRVPNDIPECVRDVLAGVAFLTSMGKTRIGLVGHSFGGAVVIRAAAANSDVAAVVTLSSQTYGVAGVDRISPRPILLIHGLADENLPPRCSQLIYRLALEPKELVLLPGTAHNLKQSREHVRRLLADWLTEKLVGAAAGKREPREQRGAPTRRCARGGLPQGA